MRKWLNEIMEGQDQLKETVSQDEADDFTLLFKTNPLARPCSVDDFRYWIAGGPKSAWNKGASYVFVEILEKRKLIATPDVQTRDAIREAFLLRLKTLHASWMERQKMLEDNKNPRSLFSKRWQRKNTVSHFLLPKHTNSHPKSCSIVEGRSSSPSTRLSPSSRSSMS